MAASYPTSIFSGTTKTAGQTIQPAHINDLQAEITAIETALINGFPQTFVPLTDATYDLGSTSKKFRDLFLSRNALIGGTLGVTGATTLAALAATTGAFSGAVTAATYNAILAIVAATGIATLTAPAGQNARLRLSSPSTFSSALFLDQASTNIWALGYNITGSSKALEFYNTTHAATMLSLTEAGVLTVASTISGGGVIVAGLAFQQASGLSLQTGLLTIDVVGGNALNIQTGAGTPEGAIIGIVGALFLRTDGGATTTLYVKTSGTGNIGWTAK